MKPLISLLLSLVFAVTLFAQKEDVTVETSFPSTLVKAEKLPLADYPEAGREAGLRGSVSVDVTLDEEGKVVSAENARGPYPVCQSVTDPGVMSLRNSALAAAREARFKPIDGQATVGMKGRITYNFGSEGETDAVVNDRLESSDIGVRVVQPGKKYPKGNTDPPSLPKIVSGGVLNGKALELPRPSYPPAARAVRASGSVNVQVLIIEDGTVYSARVVSGHALLRSSSAIAACNSKFPPTLLSGNPVKVSGVITYNYVP